MGAAEVICCFFLEEKIHNRPEISDHFHTHVPEVRGKQAGTDHAGGRERLLESVGAFDVARTPCTPHTHQLHT